MLFDLAMPHLGLFPKKLIQYIEMVTETKISLQVLLIIVKSWGEDSKTAKEEGTEVMYYQANRQEGRVRHTGFDFEPWILPLMWFPPSGRSCVILHSQGSSIK